MQVEENTTKSVLSQNLTLFATQFNEQTFEERQKWDKFHSERKHVKRTQYPSAQPKDWIPSLQYEELPEEGWPTTLCEFKLIFFGYNK